MIEQDRNTLSATPDGKPHHDQPAWRRDFPIDVPQDNYVSRREFAKFLVLISGAFTVGQFWIVWKNWFRDKAGRPPITRVASVDQIPLGGSTVFDYPHAGDPCLLIRKTDGTFLAYNQECTHLSCAVIPDVDKGHLFCPCHHGFFDLTDGRPIAGPPRRPLTRIALEVRGNDIYATGMELRT